MAEPEPPHILVVDDDQRIRDLLRRYLAEQGFRAVTAPSAAEARGLLASMTFDLLVLDVMMPGESGIRLTESLRAEAEAKTGRDIPILLLTARAEAEDRIEGFAAGADDYLAKPFDPRELIFRIRAILRRAAPADPHATPIAPVLLGSVMFEPSRGELRAVGEAAETPARLTASEAALLSLLAARAGETLSREDIASGLGLADAGERAIDVQVVRLRRKIEPDPREPRFLHTVRGRGYLLRPGP